MFEALFAAETRVDIVKLMLPGYAEPLYLGSLTAEDYVEWQATAQSTDPDEKKSAAALLIANSLVQGPEGPFADEAARMAAEKRVGTREMVSKFRQIKIGTSERIVKAILKLNGVNQPDVEKVKNG